MIPKNLLKYISDHRIEVNIRYVPKTESYKITLRKQWPGENHCYETYARDFYINDLDGNVYLTNWDYRMEKVFAAFEKDLAEMEEDEETNETILPVENDPLNLYSGSREEVN